MSGRPKNTEAEDLRQLTREAHEAIKDLRLGIREIRAERAEHVSFLADSLQLAANAGIERIGNEAQTALDFLQAEIQKVTDHLNALLGSHSAEDLTEAIVTEAARSLASQLTLGLDEHGQLVIKPREQPGQVFVTTDPALAPPGSIILDGRTR